MKIELTLPPSANNLFANGKKGRYPTAKYEAWQKVNYYDVLMKRPYNGFEIPVRIIITIRGGKGFPESSDIDNRIKAVLDLLKTCGVIAGDTVKYVREVRAVYIPPEGDERATCTVELFPVGNPIQVPTARR